MAFEPFSYSAVQALDLRLETSNSDRILGRRWLAFRISSMMGVFDRTDGRALAGEKIQLKREKRFELLRFRASADIP